MCMCHIIFRIINTQSNTSRMASTHQCEPSAAEPFKKTNTLTSHHELAQMQRTQRSAVRDCNHLLPHIDLPSDVAGVFLDWKLKFANTHTLKILVSRFSRIQKMCYKMFLIFHRINKLKFCMKEYIISSLNFIERDSISWCIIKKK